MVYRRNEELRLNFPTTFQRGIGVKRAGSVGKFLQSILLKHGHGGAVWIYGGRVHAGKLSSFIFTAGVRCREVLRFYTFIFSSL